MSAAIVVPESAEHVSVRPVSSDVTSGQVLPIGISFAKSFYERVGDPALLQNETSEAGMKVPAGGKAVAAGTESDPLASILSEPKKRTLKGPEISGHGKLEGSVASGIVRSPVAAGAGVQPRKSLVDSSVDGAESSAGVELTADDVLAAPPSVAQTPMLSAGGPDEVVAVVPSAAEPAVPNFTVTPVKMKEVVALTKISKPQVDGGASKSVHKTAGAIVSEIQIKATPAVRSEASVTPVAAQSAAAYAVPVDEIGKKASEASVEISEGAKASMQGFANKVDASVRKGDVVGESKVDATDAQMQPVSVVEPRVIEKATDNPEKVAAVAIPALQEGDSKTQSAPDISAAIVHSIFGRPEALVNIAAAVGSSSVGDSRDVKLAAGSGGHLPGLPMEPRERDGIGSDAAPMEGMPRMLTATPTTLEAGIPNGTHGWLKVRAEMVNGGGINASVSAASPAGQEMLHRELPSLTAYLQQEKVSVNAVVIHAATAEAPRAGGSGSGTNASMDGGSSQTPQRNSEGGEKLLRASGMLTGRAGESISFTETDKDGLIAPVMYDGGGSWLSVRA